jgi:hypothetical protein
VRISQTKKYGPNKNRFDDGPYTTIVDTTNKKEKFIIKNKRGNWVHRCATPELAVSYRDRWNLKFAEWVMLKP